MATVCMPARAMSGNDTTQLFIERISDIDFHEQQYEIAFWLKIHWKGAVTIEAFKEQLQVWGAKKTDISVIELPGGRADSCCLRIKITCLMQQKWRLDGYPFDGQTLKIHIHNASLDTSQFSFGNLRNYYPDSLCSRICSSVDSPVKSNVILENGWFLHGAFIKAGPMRFRPGSSGFTLRLFLDRDHAWSIFFKLFIGMYVSFFVAWMAFFIEPAKVEPRFGLPLGALFAAIGNKYIVEGFLPQSPELSIVDLLHASTFIMILLVISLSAFLLRCQERAEARSRDQPEAQSRLKPGKEPAWKRNNRLAAISILTFYLLLNIVLIVRANMDHNALEHTRNGAMKDMGAGLVTQEKSMAMH